MQLSEHLDREEADIRGVKVKGGEVEATGEHHDAAIRIQNVHRTKHAKKHVAALREVPACPCVPLLVKDSCGNFALLTCVSD